MTGPLRVRLLHPDAVAPARAHDGDFGYDLRALEGEHLDPGARAMVRTGVAIALPRGHAGLVLPRSGLAAEHGIALVNAPGLIDEGYRGEVRVLLLNTDRERAFRVEPGMRIAQLLLVAPATPEVAEVEDLDETPRGTDGFGSTGFL